MNDLKFAFRQLLKNPGFTAVAVLTVALALWTNVAQAHPSSGIVVDQQGQVFIVGQSLPEAERPSLAATFVAFDYFQAMGIPLLEAPNTKKAPS